MPESESGRLNRSRRTKRIISLTLKQSLTSLKDFLNDKRGREIKRKLSFWERREVVLHFLYSDKKRKKWHPKFNINRVKIIRATRKL